MQIVNLTFYGYRGDSFCCEFFRLGEVRSIIPEYVNVMALTATTSVSTRKEIIKSLDMQNPVVVSVSPMKENILLCIEKDEGERVISPQ